MPNFQANMNKEEDKILMAYGETLAKAGFIKTKVTKYSITSFILKQAIKGYLEQSKKEIPEIPA